MKALSLTQPYATLVVAGEKEIETRSWKTNYRGTIAIHAAQNFPKWAKDLTVTGRYFQESLKKVCDPSEPVPLGAILGTVEIVACLETERIVSEHPYDIKLFRQFSAEDFSEKERSFGDYSFYPKKRYGWFLRNPKMLKTPIICKGALSLWEVPKEIEQRIFLKLPAKGWADV